MSTPAGIEAGSSSPSPTVKARTKRLCAYLFLLAFTLIFFRSPLLERTEFYVWDLGILYLPVHVSIPRLPAAGEVPLWNRHSFLGYPSQAECEVSGLYPPTLIFNMVEDPGFAYTLYIVFHYLVALASMMFLLRVLQAGVIGQTAAALVFAFGGSFVGYTYGLPWITTFAWAPLILGLQLSAFAHRSYARAAVAGIVLAISISGCHPQTMFYVCLIMLAAMLCQLHGRDRWSRFSFAFRSTALIGIIGLCLSAPQVFYFLELMTRTVRWTGESEAMPIDRDLPPQYLLQAIVPNFLGDEPRNYLFFFEKRFYFGMLSLGLIALSWKAPAKHVRLFWGVMVASGIIALGDYGGVYRVMSRLPGFDQVHSPQRLVMMMSLAGAILAGVGLDRLVREGVDSPQVRRNLLRGYGIVAVTALMCGGLVLSTGDEWLRDYARFVCFGIQKTFVVDSAMLAGGGRSALWAALLACLCALFWAVSGRRSCKRYVGPAALCLLAADLLICNGGVNQYQPSGDFSKVPWTAELLREEPGLWRTVSLHDTQRDFMESRLTTMPGYSSALFGIDSLDYIPGAKHAAIWEHFGDPLRMGRACTLKELGIFNVKYLLMPARVPGLSKYKLRHLNDQYVYENPLAQPRVAVRERYVVMTAEEDLKSRLNSRKFNHFDSVLLSQNPEFVPGDKRDEAPEKPTVTVSHYGAHRVAIDAELPRRGILLMNDLHYPGWQATSNGRKVDILLANGFVRGLALGPGRHHVEFTYHPASFYWGVRVCVAMSLMLVAFGAAAGLRKLRSSKLETFPR